MAVFSLLRSSSFLFTRFNKIGSLNINIAKRASSSIAYDTSSFSSISSFKAFTSAIKYRLGRYYYSFYYSQASNKYVLLILFPALFFYIRFRHDTTLAYRIYTDSPGIDDVEGSTSSFQAFSDKYLNSNVKEENSQNNKNNGNQNNISTTGLPNNNLISLLSSSFSNGTKVYMDDNATVKQLKEKVFKSSDQNNNLDDIQVSCHGRILNDDDSLAFSVRAFCRRDPKLYFSKIIQ